MTAFLVGGIVAADPTVVGEPYIDGSGNRYLPLRRAADDGLRRRPPGLCRGDERARARDVEQLAS